MAPTKGIFSISNIVNNDGCFDLQFRKDTRRERTNSPTYYRWKAQFVVTGPKESAKVLQKIKYFIKNKNGFICCRINRRGF